MAFTSSPTPGRPTVAAIFEAEAAFVLRTARRLGVPPGDVDDVGQEVFLVVHRKLDTYDPSTPLRSWLFGIVRRVAADRRKRAHVRREYAASDKPEPRASHPDVSEQIALVRKRALLDDALAELDDEKREVFVLYELEEMPMPEIAQAIGCPAQTAYSRLHRARELVKKHIERELAKERNR